MYFPSLPRFVYCLRNERPFLLDLYAWSVWVCHEVLVFNNFLDRKVKEYTYPVQKLEVTVPKKIVEVWKNAEGSISLASPSLAYKS